MITRRILVLAAALWVVTVLDPVGSASAAPDRMLSGELVVMDAAAHRFRIVGQNGLYTAPAETPLESLDGHDVRVEVTSRGTVSQITEVPVPIQPVTHGWSTAQGQLVVADAAMRRFTFAGDTQMYVAPPATDVAAYDGTMVEIKLNEEGQVIGFHPLSSPRTSLSTLPAFRSCTYRGATYAAGVVVCQSGTQYRCDGTQWLSVGGVCEEGRGSSVSPLPRRSCMVGGVTVASGSGVCRDGTTLRCDDGTWIDAQTACR